MSKYNAKSLISIIEFFGTNVTPEQQDSINGEIDNLSALDQSKVLDFYKQAEQDVPETTEIEVPAYPFNINPEIQQAANKAGLNMVGTGGGFDYVIRYFDNGIEAIIAYPEDAGSPDSLDDPAEVYFFDLREDGSWNDEPLYVGEFDTTAAAIHALASIPLSGMDLLADEYTAFLEVSGLPAMSADELAAESELVTTEQRDYLLDFVNRWNETEEKESAVKAKRRCQAENWASLNDANADEKSDLESLGADLERNLFFKSSIETAPVVGFPSRRRYVRSHADEFHYCDNFEDLFLKLGL